MEEYHETIEALLAVTIIISIISIIGFIIGIFKKHNITELPNKINQLCNNCKSDNKQYLVTNFKIECFINKFTNTLVIAQIFILFIYGWILIDAGYTDNELMYLYDSKIISKEIIHEIKNIVTLILGIKINFVVLIVNFANKLLFGKIKINSIVSVCNNCGNIERFYVK